MIQKIRLGISELNVSRLCFGTEPFSIKKWMGTARGQGDQTPEEGGRILSAALSLGVNFWDTSDDYLSHPHVAEGLKRVKREDVVIADKSSARTFDEGEAAVRKALKELKTEYIDLMLLHNVPYQTVWADDSTGRNRYESANLEGRRGALKAFCQAKERGLLKAVGLTTHSSKVLKQVLAVPEIEVVCTVLNRNALFLEDGSLEQHIECIRNIYDSGRGVYVIKLLGGGRFRAQNESSVRFGLQFQEFIHGWNIGMYSVEDLKTNLNTFAKALTHFQTISSNNA